MRKDFYIFRHGETDYNKEHRWQGCSIDAELNDTGRAQAATLISKLKNVGLEIIYSSPLKRAKETAEIVAKDLKLPVEFIGDLREGCFGEAEGMLKDEISRKFPVIFEKWYNGSDDLDVGFPQGETKRQMQQRMQNVLSGLLSKEYKTIGLASHGSSIRYLLTSLSVPPHHMPNVALFHIVYDNGVWSVEE